jgi:hypothetical protein
MEFGQLRTLNVRQLWPHEERDFTPWLSDNLNALGSALGLDLEFLGREVDVGGYFLDVYAQETGSGRYVVIENQFGSSDHDHLGKLLTYAGGKQAAVLVWVTEKMRDEHRQALEWLNEHSDENTLVFGIELTAFQIDNSRPVFQFKVVCQPNDWAKESRASRSKGETSDKQKQYQAFFQQLIDELREVHRFTNARIAQAQSWYSFSSGYRGIRYGAWYGAGNKLTAEIYLDCGDKEENKRRFDLLHTQSTRLEEFHGTKLIWQRLDDRQASRICIQRDGAITDDAQGLDSHKLWLIEQLLKLKALTDRLVWPIVQAGTVNSAANQENR